MFRVNVPECDWEKVADYCATHTMDNEFQVASKVFGGAEYTAANEVTDTLGYFMNPTVNNVTGHDLRLAYSFAWVYPNGSFVAPHIDRNQLHWYCGIMAEQDADWSYDTQYGGNWFSMPSKVGQGIIMDGSRYMHKRPVYQGERAVSLVISYANDQSEVDYIRNDLQLEEHQSQLFYEIANRISLNTSDCLGFENRDNCSLETVKLPISNEKLLEYREAVRSEVYHRHSADKTLPVLHGQVFTPLLELHMELKDWMKNYLNTEIATIQPTGLMYQQAEHDYIYRTSPLDDYFMVIPFDQESASWKVVVGGGEPESCPYGSALLYKGYPTTVTHQYGEHSSWAHWAIVPFRLYSDDNVDNVFVI